MDNTILVALIAGGFLLASNAVLIVANVRQNTAARQRDDRLRAEADARAERVAETVAQEREQQREHDIELARQRRTNELSDAWRMTRLEAYRDLRSTASRVSTELNGMVLAIKYGGDVPMPAYLVLSDAANDAWQSAYSEVVLLGGAEVTAAARSLSMLVAQADLETGNRVREHHGEDVGQVDRHPTVYKDLDRAIWQFTQAVRRELGVVEEGFTGLAQSGD